MFILLHNIKTLIIISFEINRHSKTPTSIKHIDFYFSYSNLLIRNKLSLTRSKISQSVKKARTIHRMLKTINRIKIKMFIDHFSRKVVINRHRLVIFKSISFDRDIKFNNVSFIKISISIIENIVFSTRTMKIQLNKKSIIKSMTTSLRKNKRHRLFTSKISINRKRITINSKRLLLLKQTLSISVIRVLFLSKFRKSIR